MMRGFAHTTKMQSKSTNCVLDDWHEKTFLIMPRYSRYSESTLFSVLLVDNFDGLSANCWRQSQRCVSPT